MADAKQLKLLKQGVEKWNRWRAKHPDVVIDLSQADLPEALLRGADLQGADLAGAFLFMADLTGANLAGATLRGAILSRAVLTVATLTGANLTNAELRGANLRWADLRDAVLKGAYLYRADLTGVNLSAAQRREAIFDRKENEVVRRHAQMLEEPWDEASPPSPPHSKGQEAAPPQVEPPPAPPVAPALEEVCFTSIYSKEGQVETWQTLLVYAHVPSALDDLRQDAQRFAEQIPSPKEVSVPASTQFARGTELTIVPSCDKVTFNPERTSLKWLEDFQRAEFRFRGDASLADDAARGRIDIYVGPLIVGTLTFAMLFNKNVPSAAPMQEEHGRMYRQEDIFVSYSHKDTAVVLTLKKAYEAIGFNVLIDADTLRSGQVWNDELMNMIDRASIFQLFWSQNSGESKYCRQEWEHALKKNRDGFIRPVYWQRPMFQPPEELSKYHFEYMEMGEGMERG